MVDLDHLSRASEVDEDDLIDLPDDAVAAALVREAPDSPGRYSFAHALVQHTLYQEVGATRRARAHRQVAEALEEICEATSRPRDAELAHHWFNAVRPVDARKAVMYSQRAGHSALESLAPSDAAKYFSQALELLEHVPDADDGLWVDLEIGLGIAYRQSGDRQFRETLLEAARRAQESGDPERLIKAALENNRGFYSALGVVDDDKVAALEVALRAAGPDDNTSRAVLLATLCSELSYGPLERRLELADEARAMAERLNNPQTIIDMLNLIQLPLYVPETIAQRSADSSRALTLAKSLDDPIRLFWALHFDCHNQLQQGEVEEARRQFTMMRSIAEELGQPMLAWVSSFHDATEALASGDPDRAEELRRGPSHWAPRALNPTPSLSTGPS